MELVWNAEWLKTKTPSDPTLTFHTERNREPITNKDISCITESNVS